MHVIVRALLIVCFLFISNPSPAQNLRLGYIGRAVFETGTMFRDVELGGLSGMVYDDSAGIFYVISDDYSNVAPARFYTMKIDLSDGRLSSSDVRFIDVTFLKNPDGEKFGKGRIDAEGIALKDGKLFIASEGLINHGVMPFIAAFDKNGNWVQEIDFPEKFRPGKNRGMQHNKGFEAFCLSPDGRYLFCANEEPLLQDNIAYDIKRGTPVRILRIDLQNNFATKEFLYWVSAILENGFVEMVSLSETRFITLERSYIKGIGNSVRIYEAELSGAEDISGIAGFKGTDITKISAARKTRIFDLNNLPDKQDNFEGMAFGPVLPDGKRSLLIVSDNNFNESQATIFLAFSITENVEQAQTLSISEIQGGGHTSPYVGRKVNNVRGIVTALSASSRTPGFWLQSRADDGNIATSQGIFVEKKENEIVVSAGDSLRVNGAVEELGRRGELTLTQIRAQHIEIISSGHSLPEPVIIGENGRRQPDAVVDDDSLKSFDPETDGIDFYESLEGMRVTLQNPLVVDQLNRFNEMVVVPDRGRNASGLSSRGGIVLGAEDPNPERLFLIPTEENPARPKVGDFYDGDVTGILFYSFGNYKVIAYEPLPGLVSANTPPEVTSLKGDKNHLTVATYNVYNLGGADEDEKFARIAKTIVKNLQAPDILALQEIQDNDGPEKSEIVNAARTLIRLIEHIEGIGGPKYDFCQINPVRDKEGGQPGGNIRVAFLYNAKRVGFEPRGQSGSTDSVLIVTDAKGLGLFPNPGRISPKNEAFERSRVPLAAEFSFNGHELFVINNHLRSKGGDDAIFGAVQPPVFGSEDRRIEQAGVISGFIKNILQQNARANIVVLGDMNEHEFRRPMQILKQSPLHNLTETVPQNERYSYIYQGNSQLLDHIFVSDNLMKPETEADIVHINAEYPVDLRASDHDPVVARFRLPK